MKKIISIILVICSFVMLLGGCGEPKEIYLKPEEEATVNFFKRKYKSIDEGEEESIKNEVVEFLTFEGKDGVAKLDIIENIYHYKPKGESFYQKGRRVDVYNQTAEAASLVNFIDYLDGEKQYQSIGGYYTGNIFYWFCGYEVIFLYKRETDIDGIYRNMMHTKIKSLKDILKTIPYDVISVAENGLFIKIDLKDVSLSTFNDNEGKYKKFNLYFCKNEDGEIVATLFDFKFNFGKDDYGEGVFTWQTNITPNVSIEVLRSYKNLEEYQKDEYYEWDQG